MTTRSIVEIDVRSQEFEKFQALFAKYQSQLKQTQSTWAEVAKQNKLIAGQTRSWLSSFVTGKVLVRDVVEAQKDQNKHLVTGERMWTSISKSAKSVAGSILGATKSLLSWSGIITGIGGLLGAGGLFGLNRLASDVSNQRRTAMGLGVSIGGRASFQNAFARLIDPDSFLNLIGQVETDPSQWSSYALGVNPTGDTEKDAVSMLKAMRRQALATPRNQLGLLDQQFGTNIGFESWQRLKTTSEGEFQDLLKRNQANKSGMNISERAALGWQNLETGLEGNWGKVKASFQERVGQLAPPLERLSNSFTKLALTLINSPMIERGITAIGNWIDKVAKVLGSPDFESKTEGFISTFGQGVESFVNGIERVAAAIEKIASYLPGYDGGATATAGHSRFFDQIATVEQNSGLAPGQLAFIKRRESGDSLTASVGAAGERGVFQLMPDTAQWLNRKYHKHLDPDKPGDATVLAALYEQDAMARYHGNVQQSIAAYNAGEGAVDAAIAKYGKNWQQGIPQSTRDYIQGAATINMNVTVTQPPGTHTEISASQLR